MRDVDDRVFAHMRVEGGVRDCGHMFGFRRRCHGRTTPGAALD
jgi:hypothetical protein